MEIVIKIHEEDFEHIKLVAEMQKEEAGLLIVPHSFTYIANGIPLPKGHGALKDATTLMKMFEDKVGDVFTAFHFFEAIGDCPTIIEADEGGMYDDGDED